MASMLRREVHCLRHAEMKGRVVLVGPCSLDNLAAVEGAHPAHFFALDPCQPEVCLQVLFNVWRARVDFNNLQTQ